ncbi:MAG: copper resistance protein CopC [Chloroflexales bacterium]
MRHLTRTRYHWVIVLALSALIGAGVAWAHPKIIAMEPSADAQLKEPPAQLRITFNERLEAISSLALRDSRGSEVASGGAPRPDNPAILALDLPHIGPGFYTMTWTVVGSDGHIVKGNAAFTVLGDAQAPVSAANPGPAAEPAHAPPAPGPTPLVGILLRAIMLIGAATGTGGLAFLIWALGPALAHAGGDPAALHRGQVWLTIPLLICAVAATLTLVDQTAAAFGAVSLPWLLRVASTRYGQVLLVRVGLAVALAITAVQLRRDQHIRHGVCLALSAWLLLNFSLGGHAATDSAPMLTILADAIHLGATALWAGGLLAFAAMLPGALRSAPESRHPDLLRALFAQFSTMAAVSVTVLIVTGTYAATRRLGILSDLWTTSYGLALLTKLVVFGAMLLFGAYYLLAARPQLDAWAAAAARQAQQLPRLLGRTLRLEAALGLIAISAAGVLTSLAPPAGAPAAAVAPIVQPTPTAIRVPTVTPGQARTPVPSVPFDQTQPAGDLRVRLEVRPASIGDDRFRVTVTDQGGAPVATQLVRLTLAMLEMDMGTNQLVATPEALSSYAVSGAPLSIVGDWQVTVTVRRAGVRDVEAVFTVPVGE